MVPACDVMPYHEAYAAFEQLLSERSVLDAHFRTVRLEEGDLVTFNQRRILHGRTKFEQNGLASVRHLRGTYLCADEWMNEYHVLSHKLGKDFEHSHIGHGTLNCAAAFGTRFDHY
jgi:gamma-butyrobetaine dioxygenase